LVLKRLDTSFYSGGIEENWSPMYFEVEK